MNLFDLFVKIGVDDQASKNVSKIAQNLGNGLKTAAKVGVAAIGAAMAGITALTKSAIDNYAEYEQLVGGVETLFGNSYETLDEYKESVLKSKDSIKEFQKQFGLAVDGIAGPQTMAAIENAFSTLTDGSLVVMENARVAFRTAGLSVNDYMETVTSFSASLIQSLGGDTAEAAKIADIAIVDMADNANKMGTSMEMIQNAYQGFAKQNYTMLDNLKLGYGGTKTEMERLIQDANKVKEANGEMADLSIDSFADIVEAIHIIQTEMGIAGATAEEAATTISGSTGMMKASWENLVTGVADENADMDQLIEDFVSSADTAADNILPRVEIALSGAGKLIDRLIPEIVNRIPGLIATNLPIIANSAVSLISALGQGISENKDVLIKSAFETISFLAESILDMLPDILDLGLDVMLALADGIVENVDEIVPAAVEAITTLALTLTDPERIMLLVNAAIDIMMALADSLTDDETIKKLTDAAPTIISNLVAAIVEAAPDLLSAGVEILGKLFTALTDPENLALMGDAALEIINSIGRGVNDLLEDLWDIGVKIIGNIFGGMQSEFSKVENWMGNALRSALGIKPSQGSPEFWRFVDKQFDGQLRDQLMPEQQKDVFGEEWVFPTGNEQNYTNKPVVSVIQNIYSEAKTAADLMEEALYEQERAVWLGV